MSALSGKFRPTRNWITNDQSRSVLPIAGDPRRRFQILSVNRCFLQHRVTSLQESSTTEQRSPLEMELGPKTHKAALKHLRRLIERATIRLVLLNHHVRVQAV